MATESESFEVRQNEFVTLDFYHFAVSYGISTLWPTRRCIHFSHDTFDKLSSGMNDKCRVFPGALQKLFYLRVAGRKAISRDTINKHLPPHLITHFISRY